MVYNEEYGDTETFSGEAAEQKAISYIERVVTNSDDVTEDSFTVIVGEIKKVRIAKEITIVFD